MITEGTRFLYPVYKQKNQSLRRSFKKQINQQHVQKGSIMIRNCVSCFLAICLLCLCPPIFAEEIPAACAFDGFVLQYPARLEVKQDEAGIFIRGEENGFIQINTERFPDGYQKSASDLLRGRTIDHLKQDIDIEGFTYDEGSMVISIGDHEYVYLTAQKNSVPFYQYIAVIDSVLIIFTIKGETYNKLIPSVLATLRKADKADLALTQYTGDPVTAPLTRADSHGKEELIGYSGATVKVKYGAFMDRFQALMVELTGAKNPGVFHLSRCYYSDGQYVRIFKDGQIAARIYTSGPEDTSSVTGLHFTGSTSMISEKEMSTASAVVLIASYEALGYTHYETIDRFIDLLETGLPKENGDEVFWTDNGYETHLGRNEREYFGTVCLHGAYEKRKAKNNKIPDTNDLPPIDQPELTAEVFIDRYEHISRMLTPDPKSAIMPDETPVQEDGGFVLNCPFRAVHGKLKLYLKDGSAAAPVIRILIECPSEYQGLMSVACMSAFFGATDLDDEEIIDVLCLADESDTLWGFICSTSPFVRTNDVTLQASVRDGQLIAVLHGSEE